MGELLILIIGLFALLVLTYFLSEFDFYSPSFIICLIFTFGALLALYVTILWKIPDDIFSSKATMIILSGTIVFIFFEQITRRIIMPKKIIKKRCSKYIKPTLIHISTPRMLILIIICVLGTLLYVKAVYYKVCQNGYRGGFNLAAIAIYNHKLAFSDNVKGSIGKIPSLFNFGARISMYICIYILCNNVICCHEKFILNLKYIIPIITWIPNILVTSSRGSFLQLAGGTVFFIYVCLCRKSKWIKMKKIHHKIMFYASLSFISILILFYIVCLTGLIGRKTEQSFIDNIAIYVGAPIIHFNQFITDPPNTPVKYFGQETFTNLLPNLKIIKLNIAAISYQTEMRTIAGKYRGNVYTFFRRPYHDFGLIGMYFIISFTSILFSGVYYKQIYGKYHSYQNDRGLILYAYFFYTIYIFSIDCTLYMYIVPRQILNILIYYAIYELILGKSFYFLNTKKITINKKYLKKYP